MIQDDINFTFRLSKDDNEWLGDYAKKAGRTKAGVLREIIGCLRNGIHTTDLKFKGYRTVMIKDGPVVVVPKGDGLEQSLQKALEIVKVLGLK